MNATQEAVDSINQLLDHLGLDPFIYQVVVILGIVVWIYGQAVADYALAGPALWMRRAALLVASVAVVLFAFAARRM